MTRNDARIMGGGDAAKRSEGSEGRRSRNAPNEGRFIKVARARELM